MKTEAERHADFTRIRYAQLWEDADILLDGLNVDHRDHCLSIASAGDNALALLGRSPEKVVAIDLNPSQIACLELRVAAYRSLQHPELLELLGVTLSLQADPAAPRRRFDLYQRIREDLSDSARQYWDQHPGFIRAGAATVGKFEKYFELFRRRILPLVHSRATIDRLLEPRSRADRRRFYAEHWNTWRWRLLFSVFFSRQVMGALGRDSAFFRYVEGSVAKNILSRVEYALTELEPADNSYLQWILCGGYREALPYSLRADNFESIRRNLGKLEWRLMSLEEYLESVDAGTISKFNLSDVFEYMSEEAYHGLLERICRAAQPGARLAYWNMLVPRQRPDSMKDRLQPMDSESETLHRRDKAFFYSRFVLEEVIG